MKNIITCPFPGSENKNVKIYVNGIVDNPFKINKIIVT
jgi:hypothetical protein